MDDNNKEIVFEKLTVDEDEIDRLTDDQESKVRGGEIILKPERRC